jgi:hypothetical protein
MDAVFVTSTSKPGFAGTFGDARQRLHEVPSALHCRPYAREMGRRALAR